MSGFGTTGPRECPCGTGAVLGACCGPLLSGERLATTAEELMRSRYTAFAVGDTGHLVRTWHPRTRPDDVGADTTTTWTGLRVLRTEAGGPADADGVVEFVASFREPQPGPGADRADRAGELREVSRFTRRAGRWLYVDGDHR